MADLLRDFPLGQFLRRSSRDKYLQYRAASIIQATTNRRTTIQPIVQALDIREDIENPKTPNCNQFSKEIENQEIRNDTPLRKGDREFWPVREQLRWYFSIRKMCREYLMLPSGLFQPSVSSWELFYHPLMRFRLYPNVLSQIRRFTFHC